MFSAIFFNEIKYWFKRPAFYIYLAIFFVLAMILAAASAGIFDSVSVTTGSANIVNSPIGIMSTINGLATLIIFLFPSIIGVAIYRDYKSEMHTILYSYHSLRLIICLQNSLVAFYSIINNLGYCYRDVYWI